MATQLDHIRARDLGGRGTPATLAAADRRTLLALLDAQSLELQAVREALRDLLASESSQSPPYEAGTDAQNAWADRRAAARNNAAAALKQSRGAT